MSLSSQSDPLIDPVIPQFTPHPGIFTEPNPHTSRNQACTKRMMATLGTYPGALGLFSYLPTPLGLMNYLIIFGLTV